MSTQSSNAAVIDSAAISLSGLCILHCLALPIIAASLPFFSVLAEAEWVHKAFVIMALPITGWAIARTRGHAAQMPFIVLAVLGLALLLASAFVEALHDYETPLTVIGALLLASAHILRWRSHHTAS
ncbi:MAG: MerC domain-containing protein [Pseudomonadota bacterium]